MSWYFIEPSDVLFFRDAKPFGAGDDHLAESIFPPNPRTVAGAFRSYILGSSDVDWKDFKNSAPEAETIQKFIGSPEGFKESAFSMRGPFLTHLSQTGRCELLCPVPQDAYIQEEKKNERENYIIFNSYKPLKKPSFNADWPEKKLFPIWPPNGIRQDNPKGIYWLRELPRENYIQGYPFSGLEHGSFINLEPRVGNALDFSVRAARKSLLYQATFVNLKEGYGLSVWLSDDLDRLLPEEGHISLGGESKAAIFKRLKVENLQFDFGLEKASRKIKVVLLTPAYFANPILQNWSEVLGFEAELLAAAIGKPLFLGSYDVANRRERAIYAYVPPGSVYFFEAKEPIKELRKPFTNTISPEMPLDRLGYGQAFLGTWDWVTLKEDN